MYYLASSLFIIHYSLPMLFLYIYISLHLLALLFPPVRKGWREHIHICGQLLGKEMYQTVCEPIDSDKTHWWQYAVYGVVYLLAILYAVVCTAIPVVVYWSAYLDLKPKKKKDGVVGENPTSRLNYPKRPTRRYPCGDPETWGGKGLPTELNVRYGLPFMPHVDQIIYVEDKPYPEMHRYIEEHLAEIQEIYKSCGFEFCSLATEQVVTTPPEVLNYLFPYRHFDSPVQSKSFTSAHILPFVEKGEVTGPSLIHFRPYADDCPRRDTEHNYFFNCLELVPDSDTPLMAQFEWLAFNCTHVALGNGRRMYCLDIKPEEKADFHFDFEIKKLKEEVLERIEKLRRLGVHEGQLLELVAFPPKISPLVITNEYRILLPDYNNREIQMTPLVKAVYFLFLRHPEGIVFKELPQYRRELLQIYKQITPRMQEENIRQSVRDVTDPTKNSINEKCARIREAFLGEFDECFAKQYYVSGKRGEPKKVELPRCFVKWPE